MANAPGDRFIGSPSTSSTSGAISDVEPDELEGFDDFTLASSWERFIASVETTCREWQAAGPNGLMKTAGAMPVDGSRNLYRIHQEIPYGKKLYVIILFFRVGPDNDFKVEWPAGLHHLQVWFGVDDFLVAAPVSPSGVILDAPEATTLLSTVAVALSSCGSDWPAFVPVHDRTRKAYKGVQGKSSSCSITFEADRIGSWVPVRFMHLEGLYELFVSKVAFTAPNTAAVPSLRVEFTMRLTYQAPMIGYDYQNREGASSVAEAKPEYDGESPNEPLWDEDLPWAEWHNVDDPVKGFELIAIWNKRFVTDPMEMAEYENVSTFDADEWFLIPTFASEKQEDQLEEGFGVRLEGLAKAFHIAGDAQFLEDFANVVKPDLLVETFNVPPTNVLERVVKDLFYEAVSPTGDGFTYKPQGHCIKGAPRNSLFGRFSLQSLFFGTCNIRAVAELWLEFVREVRWCWDECQPLPRVSPDEAPDLRTCLLHQKLQLLAVCIKLKADEKPKSKAQKTFETAERAESKDEAESDLAGAVPPTDQSNQHRVSHFDLLCNGQLSSEGVHGAEKEEPNVTTPAVKEALHMDTKLHEAKSSSGEIVLPEDEMESFFNPGHNMAEPAANIQVPKHLLETSIEDLKGPKNEVQSSIVEFGHKTPSVQGSDTSEDEEKWESWSAEDARESDVKAERKGSAGPLENMMLLNIYEPLHAPITQRLPMMTEDMLLEREQAIAVLSRSHSEKVARIRLQTDILASDMSAFKAANPGAVLEDFVRWHSPRDWLEDDDGAEDGEISGSRQVELYNENWPPKGRLSKRMSQPGNVWAQIWEKIAPEPASEQRPLFDYKREGEKVLHYLDTVRPQQLLGQMLCTAFVACTDILRRTKTGELPLLKSRLEVLCSSADVVLEPLSVLSKGERRPNEDMDAWNEALQQLCTVYKDVEKEVFLAASLYQKLKLTPSSLSGLFKSYVNDGRSLSRVSVGSRAERAQIAELFPPSDVNLPVGRRLRMGNYLNGYEPDVREVKLQCYEEDLHKSRGSRNERKKASTMASHRMYICGTANDLQVALSVVSRD